MEINNLTKYVAYYRVSTAKQGASGLGLDAQKNLVLSKIKENGQNGVILSEYVEIESGKKVNRLQLEKALEHAAKENAVLVVAKLDRLSRDVEFIFKLKNSGVQFKACDMSDFNTLTIGMFATIAQYEREITSERTVNALKSKMQSELAIWEKIASGKDVSNKVCIDNKEIVKFYENELKEYELERLKTDKAYKKIALNEIGTQLCNNLIESSLYVMHKGKISVGTPLICTKIYIANTNYTKSNGIGKAVETHKEKAKLGKKKVVYSFIQSMYLNAVSRGEKLTLQAIANELNEKKVTQGKEMVSLYKTENNNKPFTTSKVNYILGKIKAETNVNQ